MARIKAAKDKVVTQPGPMGHNAGTLTRDEQDALFHNHMVRILAAKGQVDHAKETLKGLRKTEKKARDGAKNDGFPLKVIDEIIEDEERERVDLNKEAEQRYWMRLSRGLPVGSTADLFKLPTLVRDETLAEADGYTAGLHGKVKVAPSHIDTSMHQPWFRGWDRGQEKLGWALSEEGKVIDRVTDDEDEADADE